MHNINIQVDVPILNDSCAYMLDLQELDVGSQYLVHGCLLRGIFCAPFLPLKESSYFINGNDFDISCKREGQVKSILTLINFFTCITLKEFQLVDFNLRLPKLSISVSPADISMLLAYGKVSSKGSRHARSGRQLWKLAANRIGHVISAPRLMLHKTVFIVRLWLQYVNAYEYLLLLIGYSADHLLKKSATKMSEDKMFLSSVIHQWEVISDIEKALPVESIAQARRIARCRAALNVQSANFNELFINTRSNFFRNIILLLAFIWKVIYKLFHIVVSILFLRNILAKEPNNEYLEIIKDNPYPQFCFILNIGRIQISISYENENRLSAIEKLESHTGIPCLDLVSFSLLVDELLLKYVQDICEQSLMVSCGQFKVKSSQFMDSPVTQSNSKEFLSSVEGHWKERNHEKTILWCEPALVVPLSESSNANVGGACDSFLESLLGLMWLNWKTACMKFGRSKIQYSENPCFLCEIKSSMTYPDLKNSIFGFWKCLLTLGKMNFSLDCSSVLSISLLLRQMQHALCRTGDNGRSRIHSHSPTTIKSSPEISLESNYEYYASSLKMTLLRMLPEKHIQLGVFMAGPHVNFSVGKDFKGANKDTSHFVSHDSVYLAFDVQNIEVAVWPALAFDPASYIGSKGPDNADPDCIRFKQPQIIDLPKSDNEKYLSRSSILLGSYFRVSGLNAYLGSLAEKQHSEVFALKLMTVQLSTFR